MANRFYITNHLIDPTSNSIVSGEVRHKIEPKIMQVLLCLIEANGEVVSKDDLLKKVWHDTVVVDMVLTRAISHLRSVFQDDPTNPTYIETISKTGYRLVAPIEENPRKKTKLKITPIVIGLTVVALLIFGFLATQPPEPLSIQPFAYEKSWEYHPDISHDGKWVAYVSRSGSNSSILIESLNKDSLLTLVTNGNFYKPKWSKTSNMLSYISIEKGERKLNFHSFDSARPSFDDQIEVMMGMDWHPKKEAIIYLATDSVYGRNDLFEYDIDDGTVQKLEITPEDVWGDLEPAFSPDGSKLAFIRTVSEGNQDIYLKDLIGGGLTKLTNWNAVINGVDWLGANTLIISGDYGGNAALWQINTRNKIAQHVLTLPYGQNLLNPTAHGGQLIGELWEQDADLRVFSDEGIGINTTLWELHPSFNKKGSKVAFSSNRSGHYEVWVYDLKRKDSRQITDYKGPFNGKPKWSNDDRYLAFETVDEAQGEIHIVESSSGDLFKSIKGTHDQINPSWSADGNCIYFSSNRSGDWNIYKQEVQSEEAIQLTQNGGFYMQEAPWPIARRFYFSLNSNGIHELLTDGTSVTLVADVGKSDWGNWVVGKEGLYYYDRSNAQIVKYEFSSNEESVIANNIEKVPTIDPSFHYNEETHNLVIGKITTYKGDLVRIANLL